MSNLKMTGMLIEIMVIVSFLRCWKTMELRKPHNKAHRINILW